MQWEELVSCKADRSLHQIWMMKRTWDIQPWPIIVRTKVIQNVIIVNHSTTEGIVIWIKCKSHGMIYEAEIDQMPSILRFNKKKLLNASITTGRDHFRKIKITSKTLKIAKQKLKMTTEHNLIWTCIILKWNTLSESTIFLNIRNLSRRRRKSSNKMRHSS